MLAPPRATQFQFDNQGSTETQALPPGRTGRPQVGQRNAFQNKALPYLSYLPYLFIEIVGICVCLSTWGGRPSSASSWTPGTLYAEKGETPMTSACPTSVST